MALKHSYTSYSPYLRQPSSYLTGYEPELSGAGHAYRPTIVHVDDEPDMLQLVKFILEIFRGYRVIGFQDGTEAWSACQTHAPDLLITDVSRPGLNGISLCELIRADRSLFSLPIILLSGATYDQIYADQFDCACLSKPCGAVELVTTVDTVVKAAGFDLPPLPASFSSLKQ